MSELEKIAALLTIGVIGWMFFSRPAVSAISGGADINGLPWFLSYNVPNLLNTDLPIPSLSSGTGKACSSCSIFGNSLNTGL